MELIDWLEDLSVRFIMNLPTSEYVSVSRLLFHVEEAQWYYEDFIRPLEASKGNPLPQLALRDFLLALFHACPLTANFTDEQHMAAYDAFLAYKVRIPVRGAILLDEKMEHAILVKGWKKGANWSFPRGKINKNEKDLNCAIREVYEETGFNVRAAGLVPANEDEAKYIDVVIREQHMRLFVIRNVPLDTHFEPKTRKEISKIAWYNLHDLPGFSKKKGHQDEAIQSNKFYMVAPFMTPLRKWIAQQRKADSLSLPDASLHETITLETDDGLLSDNPNKLEAHRKPRDVGNAPSEQFQPEPPHVRQKQELLGLFTGPGLHGSPAQQLMRGPHLQPQIPPPLDHQFPPGFLSHPYGNTGPQQHFSNAQDNIYQHSGFPSHERPLTNITDRGLVSLNQGQQTPHQFSHVQPIHSSHDEPSAMLAAPKASSLPAPKLNAHSMRLLETFKQGKPQTASTSANQPLQSVNPHQTRLLDLFRSPMQATAKPAESSQSTTLPVTEQATAQAAETSQLNTLPMPEHAAPKELSKTLPSPEQPVVQNTTPADIIAASFKVASSAQQPRPSREKKQARQDKPTSQHGSPAPVEVLQRPQSRKVSPPLEVKKTMHHTPATIKHNKHRVKPEPPKTPTFTILTRPSSGKDESTTPFQPQLLQRPVSDQKLPDRQQDPLLTLFNKASTVSSPSSSNLPASQPPACQIQPGKPVTILRPSTTLTQPVSPLNAPTSMPEQRVPTIMTQPQNDLLDLFKKKLPETPISPFNLGSPNVLRQPSSPNPTLGMNELKMERKSSSSATPTQAKGFLLGFLNNVVQKEGKPA